MTYQVKGWDDHFESAKSRQFKTRNQVYLPNKHGLGYRRLISSKNGEAMFGAWVAMCQVLSRQTAPRAGWITDDGTQGGIPLTAGDVAMLTGYSEAVVEQMLVCCASQAVAWLSVNDAKDTSGPCQGLVKDLQVPVTDAHSQFAGEGEGKGKGEGDGNGEGNGDDEKPPRDGLLGLADQIRGCRPEYSRLNEIQLVNSLSLCRNSPLLPAFVERWCAEHANMLEPFKNPLASIHKMIEKIKTREAQQ
jgi:hypothetical protein